MPKKITLELVIALILFLIGLALTILDANDVLTVPPGISEALTMLAGWLGLSKPSDAKALKGPAAQPPAG